MKPPDRQTIKQAVGILMTQAHPGEGIIEVIERIIRERDLATYDDARARHAISEAARARRVLAAAAESQPDRTLRISARALAAVGGATTELTSHVNPVSGEVSYRVIDRARLT